MGLSLDAIAKEYDVGKTTLHTYLKTTPATKQEHEEVNERIESARASAKKRPIEKKSTSDKTLTQNKEKSKPLNLSSEKESKQARIDKILNSNNEGT
ncbi:MAG: putative DNA-binding protein YlxM (UPF0122 family) [Oleiphilaceae bacterium]